MTYSFSSRRFFVFIAVGALLLLSNASVVPSYAQGAAEQEQEFCRALLAAHPKGGAGLRAEVQNLIAAAPDVAKDVLGCAGSANKAQAQALGAGLAKAVDGLKETNPGLADEIAALVAGSKSESLKTAYLGGNSEEATAAIDDGGDGGDAGDVAAAGDAGGAFAGGPSAATLTVGSSGGGTGGGSVSPN